MRILLHKRIFLLLFFFFFICVSLRTFKMHMSHSFEPELKNTTILFYKSWCRMNWIKKKCIFGSCFDTPSFAFWKSLSYGDFSVVIVAVVTFFFHLHLLVMKFLFAFDPVKSQQSTHTYLPLYLNILKSTSLKV